MVKVQFEMTEEKAEKIESIMKDAGVDTRKELFNNALTFLEWALRERKQGHVIASIDEEKKVITEVLLPIF